MGTLLYQGKDLIFESYIKPNELGIVIPFDSWLKQQMSSMDTIDRLDNQEFTLRPLSRAKQTFTTQYKEERFIVTLKVPLFKEEAPKEETTKLIVPGYVDKSIIEECIEKARKWDQLEASLKQIIINDSHLGHHYMFHQIADETCQMFKLDNYKE